MSKVGILMGSKSDFDVVKPAVAVLKKFGVEASIICESSGKQTNDACQMKNIFDKKQNLK